VVHARQNAVGALFAEDDPALGAIADLIAAGVRPSAIAVAARSPERTRRLAAPHRVATLAADGDDGLTRTLLERGIDPDRAIHFAGALGEGILLVLGSAEVDAERVGMLIRARADLGLANVGGIEHIIPLRAEQVTVDKGVVVTSEVTVRTDVITEVRTFELELQREEFVIERTLHGPEGSELRTMRIPLRHEEPVISKRTIVTEEVAVRTEQFVDVAHIEETVKHEVLHVEQRESDV
jgi:uncharacterized protein (TIGR02271 family)